MTDLINVSAPQSFINCVDALIKEGKDKSSAYAICTVQYKKMHKGHTPKQDENKSEEATIEEIETMGKFYEEVVAARKKKKISPKDMEDMIKEYMKGRDKNIEQMMKGKIK